MSDNPAGNDPTGQPDPTTEPDPVTDPPAGDDPQDDGNQDDPRVKRANQQAANYRTKLRETEQQVTNLEQQLAQQGETLQKLAAVFNPEAPQGDDPTEALATITGEAESLRTKVRDLEAEVAVYHLASDKGANAQALLDSRSFLNTLQALDASAEDYRDQVASAIEAAVQSNPTLAAGQAPARGGAPGAGQGSAEAGAVTQAAFDAMGVGERNALYQRDPDTYRRLAGTT